MYAKSIILSNKRLKIKILNQELKKKYQEETEGDKAGKPLLTYHMQIYIKKKIRKDIIKWNSCIHLDIL